MKTFNTFSALSFATVSLLACGGANQGPPVAGTAATETHPTTTTTAAANGADKSVVAQLSTARCDQEQTCNNIGDGQKYASRDVCMDKMKGDLGNDYNASDCPGGIDQSAVDRCMAAIKSEECSHPLDTMARQDKCRSGALCIK